MRRRRVRSPSRRRWRGWVRRWRRQRYALYAAIDDLADKLSHVPEARADVEALRRCTARRDALTQRVAELRRQLRLGPPPADATALRQEIARLQTEIAGCQNDRAAKWALEADLAKARNELRAQHGGAARLHQHTQQLQHEIGLRNTELAELRAALQDRTAAREQRIRELESEIAQCRGRDAQRAGLEAELRSAQAQLREDQDLRAGIEQLGAEKAQLVADLRQARAAVPCKHDPELEKHLEAAQTQITKLERELRTNRQELQSVRVRLQEQEQAVAAAQAREAQVARQLAKVHIELQAAAKQLDDPAPALKLAHAAEDAKAAEAAAAHARQTLVDTQAQLKAVQAQVAELEQREHTVAAQWEAARQQQVEKWTQQQQRLQEKLDVSTEANESAQARVRETEARAAALQTELETAQKALAAAAGTSAEATARLEAELAECRQATQAALAAQARMGEENEALQGERDQLKAALKRAEEAGQTAAKCMLREDAMRKETVRQAARIAELEKAVEYHVQRMVNVQKTQQDTAQEHKQTKQALHDCQGARDECAQKAREAQKASEAARVLAAAQQRLQAAQAAPKATKATTEAVTQDTARKALVSLGETYYTMQDGAQKQEVLAAIKFVSNLKSWGRGKGKWGNRPARCQVGHGCQTFSDLAATQPDVAPLKDWPAVRALLGRAASRKPPGRGKMVAGPGGLGQVARPKPATRAKPPKPAKPAPRAKSKQAPQETKLGPYKWAKPVQKGKQKGVSPEELWKIYSDPEAQEWFRQWINEHISKKSYSNGLQLTRYIAHGAHSFVFETNRSRRVAKVELDTAIVAQGEVPMHWALQNAHGIVHCGPRTESWVWHERDGAPLNVTVVLCDRVDETLQDFLKRGVPTDERFRQWACDLITALGQMHQAGYLHQDLSDGNVGLVNNQAKLMDLGNAAREEHLQSQPGKPTVQEGTGAFQSDAARNYRWQTYKDDWEALVNVLSYMANPKTYKRGEPHAKVKKLWQAVKALKGRAQGDPEALCSSLD